MPLQDRASHGGAWCILSGAQPVLYCAKTSPTSRLLLQWCSQQLTLSCTATLHCAAKEMEVEPGGACWAPAAHSSNPGSTCFALQSMQRWAFQHLTRGAH